MLDRTSIDLLQGTLGVLILKALSWGPMHGYGIVRWIEQIAGDDLLMKEGSCNPALHRLQADRARHVCKWTISDSNRRVRSYTLSAAGRRQLRAEMTRWDHFWPRCPACCRRGVSEPYERLPDWCAGDWTASMTSSGRRDVRVGDPNVRRDIEDELEFHLEMRQRDLTERGLAARDARDEAVRRFGDVTAIATVCRARIRQRWYREQRRATMLMDTEAGRRLRAPHAGQDARVHVCRGADAGPRHRGHDGHLRARELDAAASPAGVIETFGAGVGLGQIVE